MVEHLLAKEKVASSNLVFRSTPLYNGLYLCVTNIFSIKGLAILYVIYIIILGDIYGLQNYPPLGLICTGTALTEAGDKVEKGNIIMDIIER